MAMNRMAVFSGEYGSSILVRAGWTKCLNPRGMSVCSCQILCAMKWESRNLARLLLKNSDSVLPS